LEPNVNTQVLEVDAERPDPAVIERAAAILRAGGLVAFPTETVYGLGANATDSAAVESIFAAKGRPAHNPIIVHVSGVEDAILATSIWPDSAALLAERFWPGPLTMILPRSETICDRVTCGGPTVAIRVPAHPVAHALILAAGLPIAAPSANRSSGISPTLAEHVAHDLDGRIDMILDGGPTPGGIESTVLDLTTHLPRMLRSGLIKVTEIEQVMGPIGRIGPITDSILRSPGNLPRHYAPNTPLEVLEDAHGRLEELLARGQRVAWMTFDGGPHDETAGLEVVMMPEEPADYAASLYAVLHILDSFGLDRIVVDDPPDSEEWAAIRDRLARASTS